MTTTDLLRLKKQRGQFFTKNLEVQNALGNLLFNSDNLLEPAAGAGDLLLLAERLGKFSSIQGFEIDESVKNISNSQISYGNFFDLTTGLDNSFASILGNPPFISWKDVEDETAIASVSIKKRYQDKTNLYHLFIDRCIDLLKLQGELVFIVPKEWLYTTSAEPLRKKIIDEGVLTHLIDCGEEKLFADADVPALLIFRFEKRKKHTTIESVKYSMSLSDANQNIWEHRTLITKDNRFILLSDDLAESVKSWQSLKTQYSVKVGMVTGSDKIFHLSETQAKSLEPEAIRSYLTTKGVQSYLDLNWANSIEEIPEKARIYIEDNKTELLNRRIINFTDDNFWKYGAIRNKEAMESKAKRFYSLVKTRNETPFFKNDQVGFFGGGILGIFEKQTAKVTIPVAIKVLNSKPYRKILEAMFLTTGNKVSLQPATLEDAPFPDNDTEALSWLESQSANL